MKNGSSSQEFDTRHAQLMFLLAWFHAIVQERRTYLPQGWSKAYEFSVGDLRAGSMLLDTISRGGDLDFKLIHGLMEDAIYGGRVDNPSDLRVLRTIVAQLYNPQMLNRGGEIARGVKMPIKCGFEDLTMWAHDLPDLDSPSMFGLPENIQRAVQRSASTIVSSQLRSLDVSGNATEKFDKELWKVSLGPLIDNWSKLIDGEVLKSSKQEANEPTNQFVLFENENAMALCAFVDSQIMELKKVLFGSALLTPAIQAMGSSLMRGEVPAIWEKRWEGPETATAYLTMLVRKKKALSRWAELAMNKQLLRQPLNLSDLFNPGTFLNALKQESARMLKVPLEETKLVSAWSESKLSGCGLIATLDGMFIENAVIDHGELAEVGTSAAEITRSPALSLAFIPINQPEPSRGIDTLSIPIYCTPTREKHLVDVAVPIRSGDDAMWILAGVAFLLSGE
jgi:dynein heavy chain 2